MSKSIDPSDSSDEEICFGKYTLKEAKRDINKYIPKKPNRRHSLALNFSNSNMNTDKRVNDTVEQLNNYLDEHLNISSTPSEYLSVNESAATNRPSLEGDFIQKLSKVINEPSSKESSYKTACDQTCTTVSATDDSNETKAEFIKHFENQFQSINQLENIQQTLVENTIYTENLFDDSTMSEKFDDVITLSDDSLQISDNIIVKPDKNITSSNFKFTDCNQSNNQNECEENEINHSNSLYEESDSLLELSNAENIEFNIINANTHEDKICSKFVRKEPVLLYNDVQSTGKYDKSLYNWNYLSKISEKTEVTSFVDNDLKGQKSSFSSVSETCDFSSKSELCHDLEICNKLENSKSDDKPDLSYDTQDLEGFEVPQINLEQFDDSCNFDDTLEEMNRFLTEDIDSPEPKTSLKTSSETNIFHSPHDCVPMLNTQSSIEKHKTFFSAEKVAKPKMDLYHSKTVEKSKHIKLGNEIKSPMSKKPLFTNIPVKSKTADVFKVPTKPIKSVLTPNKSSNICLKNVVSPISVYINNTPKYSPVIKSSITQKRLEKSNPTSLKKENVPFRACGMTDKPKYSPVIKNSTQKRLEKSNLTSVTKENIPVRACGSSEIPFVIYKPSKIKQITEERDMKLPGSIKKLIKESTITKHHQKIVDVDCNKSIERRLMEEEVSIDSSLFAETDISVLTSKQALILKK